MTRFVARQNKNRAFENKPNQNNDQSRKFIPYRHNPERHAADFSMDWHGQGLSYTRKKALKRYRVLIKSGHKPKIVLDCFSQQTFPNTYQSIVYHLKKHGKGMKASEYAETALAFFIENYYRAQLKTDRTNKKSWNIKGKVGGWFTRAGRIITFWF